MSTINTKLPPPATSGTQGAGNVKDDQKTQSGGRQSPELDALRHTSDAFIPALTSGPTTSLTDTQMNAIRSSLSGAALSMLSVIDMISAAIKSLGLAADGSIKNLESSWKLTAEQSQAASRIAQEAQDAAQAASTAAAEKAAKCAVASAVAEIFGGIVSVIAGIAAIPEGLPECLLAVAAGVALIIDGVTKLDAAVKVIQNPARFGELMNQMQNGMFSALGPNAGLAQMIFQFVCAVATLGSAAPGVMASNGASVAGRLVSMGMSMGTAKIIGQVLSYAYKVAYAVDVAVTIAGQSANIVTTAIHSKQGNVSKEQEDKNKEERSLFIAMSAGIVGILFWAAFDKGGIKKHMLDAAKEKGGSDGQALEIFTQVLDVLGPMMVKFVGSLAASGAGKIADAGIKKAFGPESVALGKNFTASLEQLAKTTSDSRFKKLNDAYKAFMEKYTTKISDFIKAHPTLGKAKDTLNPISKRADAMNILGLGFAAKAFSSAVIEVFHIEGTNADREGQLTVNLIFQILSTQKNTQKLVAAEEQGRENTFSTASSNLGKEAGEILKTIMGALSNIGSVTAPPAA